MKFKPIPIIRVMMKSALYLQILLGIGTASIYASDTAAQAKSVREVALNLQLNQATLRSSFNVIEDKTNFTFVFSKERLPKTTVSLSVKDGTVMDALLEIARQADLRFKQINNNISVLPNKPDANPEVLVEITEQVSITGKVVDENGEGLPGATILEKGTSNGTVTDFNGEFALNVEENATLVFSFIGFLSQEIAVGGQTNFYAMLVEDVSNLEEVVVIGYGQVEKQDVTGAISSIKAKDFNLGVISSPEQLIQGRTTGVQVTSGSGEPGAAVNVRVRGTSSIRSGNNPLYVVDGIPLSGSAISPSGSNAGSNDNGAGNTTPRNPLIFMDPNDIVSIDILKDASATAIYGSRGANGVILITTRRGSVGKTSLNYSSSVSVSSITKKLDLLSADEFRTYISDDLDFGSETDWQDVIFREAISHAHNISFGGGNEESKYNFSLGYNDQRGIVESSGLRRYNANLNTDYGLFDGKLKLQTSIKVANILDDNPQISNDAGFTGDLLSGAWRANPTRPIFNPDGTYAQPDVNERNPAAILAFTRDETNTMRILGSIAATYQFSDQFSYKLNVGLDNSRSERRSALSGDLNIANVAGLGRADFSEANASSKLFEHTLNYNAEAGSGKIDALIGFSYQDFITETRFFTLTGFRTANLDLMFNNIEAADFTSESTARVGGSTRGIDELQSFFGRVNYALLDRYIITATVRADGSSKFGENNRYGVFPSLAVAWRLSDESFIPESIYDLKFRAGWGITGNQEFPGGNQIFRQRFDISGNLVAPQFANPNLKWETTSQINFGIDFGLVEGRVYGSIDFYKKNTKDILFRSTSALPAVQPFVFENLDIEIENTGLEFGINAILADKDQFQWNTGFNISFNRNRASNVGIRPIQTGAISGQGLTGAFAQVVADGQPLYAYYLSEFQGFDEDGFNVFANGGEPALVGKSPLPDYTFGWTNSLRYGQLSMTLFFTGQIGGYIYNNNGNALFLRGSLINGGKNVTRDVADNGEAPTNGNNVSTRWLENGSFARLQNLTFGYDFPLQKLAKVSSLKLLLTFQNLWTITNYSGQDPEVNVDKSIDGVPSLGVDYSAYPRARTITLGLNISFN